MGLAPCYLGLRLGHPPGPGVVRVKLQPPPGNVSKFETYQGEREQRTVDVTSSVIEYTEPLSSWH